jgi:hypothetical protein
MALSNLTKVQTVGIGSNIEVVGVVTTGQFKSGTSNLHSSGVELTNLNVSGIATIGGNLSIGGTLTYEDVTNIDSIGIVTARAGVNVSGGQLDVGSNIKIGNAGVVTATSFVGALTGTASGNPTLTSGANNRVVTATGANALTGETGLTYDTQALRLNNTAANPQFHLTSADNGISELKFGDQSDLTRAVILYRSGSAGDALCFNGYNNTERLRITSDGDVGIGDNNPNIRLTVVDTGTENLVRLGRSDSSGHGSHTVNIKASKDHYHNFKMEASTYQLHCYDGSSMNERFRINSNGECFIGASYHGYTNRSTDLSVTGPYQSPAGVWTQVGIYSDDGQAADKGGTIGFGGQDGSQPQQQFAAIKGAKANSTSGNYEGYMSFFIRPNGAVSQERFRINANGMVTALGAGPTNYVGSNIQENYHQFINSQAYAYTMKMRNYTWGYGLQIQTDDNTTREGLSIYTTKSGAAQTQAMILMNGTYYSRNNTYTSFSDIKLKENIVDANSQWDDIKNLKIRNFNFKTDDASQKMIGVIAQEVETISAGLVDDIPDKKENEDGTYTETGTHTKLVKYSILYMKAIKALQEAQARIETLETKVAALEGS